MKDILVQRNWKVWDADFYEEIQRKLEFLEEGEAACIDFGEVSTLNSELMTVIFVLVYHTYKKTRKQLFFSNVSSQVRDYLEDMRFFQLNYVRAGSLRNMKKLRYSKGQLIPVYRIYDDMGIRDFCQASRMVLTVGNVESMLKDSIKMALQELMMNGLESSVENSLDIPVYAFGVNEAKRITFAVVDFGMGFYQSLLQNKHNQDKIQDDQDAILGVLKYHLTGGRGAGGGMGYITIKRLIDEYQGRLLIASGNAVVMYENAQISWNQDLSIKLNGSIIFVEFEKNS